MAEMNRRSLLLSALALSPLAAQTKKNDDAGRAPEGMTYIPPGPFVMGAARAEVSTPSSRAGRGPGGPGPGRGGNTADTRHTVRLSGFYIGKYLVTNAEYRQFTEAVNGRYRPQYWDNPAFDAKAKANHPVLWVGYDQAMAYCRWLSEKTKSNITLPSEAQWERAARGATKTGDEFEFPWGSGTSPNDYETRLNYNVLCAVRNGRPKTVDGADYPYWPFVLRTQRDSIMAANFRAVVYGEDDPRTPFDESGQEVRAVWKNIMDAGGCTTAVGSYPPGPEGCCDMAGNAFEWTRDFYTVSSYIHLAEKTIDPCVDSESMLSDEDRNSGSDGGRGGSGATGGSRGTKIIRGGSWYANENSCLLHRRTETRAAGQGGYHSVGFRVVMLPPSRS
jgi:formylglycine-generating enzyme required for sulfatase activity